MKTAVKSFVILILLVGCAATTMAQQTGSSKRERKKNMVVKEWNLKAGSNTPFLDNVVTFDDQGRKIEEIEYASYGQKYRIVYEYEGNSTKCAREVEYNDKNKVVSVKKFEYNADGTKAKQYTYLPNGKLKNTKIYERIVRE
ncbi:MAG: hypothetical protein J5526_07280 [Bacteroidales bacterium]|nr:hypothetical protein [Bacteroidales bacterium]